MILPRHIRSVSGRLFAVISVAVCAGALKLRSTDRVPGTLSDDILSDIGVPRCMVMAAP